MGKDGGKETKGASGEGGGSKSVVKQHRDKQMNLGWGRGGGGLEAGNFVYSVQHMLLRLLGIWPG